MTEKRDPVEVITEDDPLAETAEVKSTLHEELADPELDLVPANDDALVADETAEAEQALEPVSELEPEDIHPADLHALAALALGIVPSAGAPDVRALAAASPGLRSELATLIPVADILTSLYQAQQSAAPPPSSTTAVASAERTQPSAPARQPRGPAPTPATASGAPARRLAARPREIGGLSATTAAIVALAVVAALALLWALALLDRVSTRDDEIGALREQVAQLRGSASASAFVLTPAPDEAPDARGTIFASPVDGTVLLDVSGLPELEGDEVYQIWYQSPGSDEWLLGPAFGVSRQGETVQRLRGEVLGFIRVAVSREPAPGSAEPSGPFLLEGTLAGGAG